MENYKKCPAIFNEKAVKKQLRLAAAKTSVKHLEFQRSQPKLTKSRHPT